MPAVSVTVPNQNTRIYTNADGSTCTLTGGSLAWRDNNPGNIRYGTVAVNNGAIGKDALGFAIFPSYDVGSAALHAVVTQSYGSSTINGMMSSYAPAFENNTSSYQTFLSKRVGVTGDAVISTLTPKQLTALENGIKTYEGTRPGTTAGKCDLSTSSPISSLDNISANSLDVAYSTDPSTGYLNINFVDNGTVVSSISNNAAGNFIDNVKNSTGTVVETIVDSLLSAKEFSISGSSINVVAANANITLAAGSNATLSGAGLNIKAGNGTVTVGGNGETSSDASVITVTTTGGTVNILDHSRVNVSGSGVTVNAGVADNFGAFGDNLTINAKAGDGVWVGGNGQYTAGIDNVYANGAVVMLVDNTRANVFDPSGGSIYAGKNTNFGAIGAGINAYLDSGSNIWVGQNGKAGAVNTVFGSTTGGAVTLLDNSNVTVNGSNNSVYMASQDNIYLSGGNNVLNTTASGTTPGAGNAIFIANTGNLSDVLNVAGSTNGNGGGITLGSNTSAIIKGASNTLVLQDGVTVSEYGAGNITLAGLRDHIYIEDSNGNSTMNQVKGTGLDVTAAYSGQAGGIYTAANTKLAVWGGHDLIKAGSGSAISDYFAGNTPDVIVGDNLSINSLGGMLDIIGTHNVLTGSYDKYRAQGTYNEMHDGSLYGGTDFNTMQFYGSDMTGDKGGMGAHDLTNYYIGQTIPDWFFSGMQGLAVQNKTNDFAALSAALWNKSPDWVPGADTQRPNWQPGDSPITPALLDHYNKSVKEHGNPHGPAHQGAQAEAASMLLNEAGIMVVGLSQHMLYI